MFIDDDIKLFMEGSDGEQLRLDANAKGRNPVLPAVSAIYDITRVQYQPHSHEPQLFNLKFESVEPRILNLT